MRSLTHLSWFRVHGTSTPAVGVGADRPEPPAVRDLDHLLGSGPSSFQLDADVFAISVEELLVVVVN